MLNKCCRLFLLLTLSTNLAGWAQTELPVSANIQNAFRKGTRDHSGIPGRQYWQNSAAYSIKVNFDPASRLLSGNVDINYVNNSPDTLKRILLKLYPNLYQKQSMRTVNIAPEDLSEGMDIQSVEWNGQTIPAAQYRISSTNMVLKNAQVLPGQHAHLNISYAYTLNKGSFIRTGQIDSGAFFLAYFFPRVAVYDDIDGWNQYPYTGQYEFYNDFCRFDVEVRVPGNYQVWATGALENAGDVYSPKVIRLVTEADNSDSVVDVITPSDIKTGDITLRNTYNTWKFKADNVTDFAVGISNHYVWKSSSLLVDPITNRRTRVDAVFNPEHTDYLPIIDYARKTVEVMSYQFPRIPYPYPHETIFDGPDEMEFPMMVDDNPFKEKKDAIELTAHEIFHTLFPFYVGTNETKYSFMDEGWATLAEFTFHPLIDSTLPVKYDISDANLSAGNEQDLPIMTLTPQLAGTARYADKDLKPALGFLYVREMLGDSLFLKGLNHYIMEWQSKHPTPYDFFNCMNAGAGQSLNWFWKNWFFEKGIPDLAITKVTHGRQEYTIEISNAGTEAIPVHLAIHYTDGTTQTITKSIACWAKGNKKIILTVKSAKTIRQLVLGTAYDADSHPENNSWELP